MTRPYLTGPQEALPTTAHWPGGGSDGMKDPTEDPGASLCWGEGRGVLRRPEVRSSILEGSYVIHSREESKSLSEAVLDSVTRRGQLSDSELAQRREQLFELARRSGVSLDDTR